MVVVKVIKMTVLMVVVNAVKMMILQIVVNVVKIMGLIVAVSCGFGGCGKNDGLVVMVKMTVWWFWTIQ